MSSTPRDTRRSSDPLATPVVETGASRIDEGVAVIERHLRTMPASPGVYRMLNRNGDVLYVGKAKNLKKRVVSYTRLQRQPNRIRRMVSETVDMEIVTTHTEAEALLLEANLIKRYKPRFNILLRDDKSFPSILITGDHPFPQVLKHRGARTRKGDYFGPFASAWAVNETLTVLQRAFLLRSCTDAVFAARTRPCLLHQIKRCSAPCDNRISEEGLRGPGPAGAPVPDRGKPQDPGPTRPPDGRAASESLEFEKSPPNTATASRR